MTAGSSGHGSKRRNRQAAAQERAALVDAKGEPVKKAPRVLTEREINLAERYAQAYVARVQAEATAKAMNKALSDLTREINGDTKEARKRAGIIFAEAHDLIVKAANQR